MKPIASFTVNHDTLTPGVYLSRVDGDAVTYDIRMKTPNADDFLSTGAAHTLEHLLATYLRNSAASDQIIYVGPMGCRTGFYLIARDALSKPDAIRLIRDAMVFAADFEGEIPGGKRRECGHYLDHDLPGARREAAAMMAVLLDWDENKLAYPE